MGKSHFQIHTHLLFTLWRSSNEGSGNLNTEIKSSNLSEGQVIPESEKKIFFSLLQYVVLDGEG